jgi:tetratricopeptide (TPR) repeat protein
VGWTAVLLLFGHPAGGDGIPMPQRIADQFERAAVTMIEVEPFTVAAADGALVLLRLATEITPEDTELWRTYLEASLLAEKDEHVNRAIEAIRRLDPADDVVALLKLTRRLERYQTVEERRIAMEQLLSEPSLSEMGPVLASRVAMELAMLEQRSGNMDAYSRRLAEAASLDPSNRHAVAAAAGFFRSAKLDDPVGEAELLLGLVAADPTDLETQITLGRLLLEHGAYAGAQRLYRMAVAGITTQGRSVAADLLADLAIAQWASGDTEGALETIHERQREADLVHRRQLSRKRPELTLVQLAEHHGPMAPTLATVRAAIHHRQRSAEAMPSLEHALESYAAAIAEVETATAEREADPARAAHLRAEAAWVALWLGAPTERVATLLNEAEAVEAMNAEARARFDGWIALRRGEIDRARELLAPQAEGRPGAAMGIATIHLVRGDRREAAREFLRVARGQPGTLMGVWSADYLAELLGRRAPITDTARQLDELIATLPPVVDRFAQNPTLAVALRVTPAQARFDAYDPIIINVQIVNNAPFPLAIDELGPIRYQVALLPFMQIPSAPRLDLPEVLIVDLGRRLRLEPRQTLTVPFDMRRTRMNQVINTYPHLGATIRLTAVSNFQVSTKGAVLPGLLGSRVETQNFRVDGVRTSEEWVRQTITDVTDADPTDDAIPTSQLAHFTLFGGIDRLNLPVDQPKELFNSVAAAIPAAYVQLDAYSQAWLVERLPAGFPFDSISTMARRSEHKLVQISYLLTRLTGRADPMLAAGLRSEDEDVRAVAKMMDVIVERVTGEDQ